MARARILLVDNDLEFLLTIAKLLEKEGYEVVTAESPEEARQIASDRKVELAVLDIRLINDQDEGDSSGMELAKTLDPGMPKVIWTTYPSYQATRQALGRDQHGLSPAVGFVAKEEESEALLTSIARGLEQAAWLRKGAGRAQIGREAGMPRFEFRELKSFRDWARKLMIEQSSEDTEDWKVEIEELVAKLAYDLNHIVLDDIDLPRTNEARAWISGETDAYLPSRRFLKLWKRENMQRERNAIYSNVVRQLGDWAMRPDYEDWLVSDHFGATISMNLDANKAPYLWLAEYVRYRNAEQIQQTVMNLFEQAESRLYVWPLEPDTETTLAHAYAQIVGLEPQSASLASLPATINRLIDRMPLRLRIVCDFEPETDDMSFHFPGLGTLKGVNPTFILQNDSFGQGERVLYRLCIGNMDGYNVLVDREGSTKLTDFASLAENPSLSDFVALEASFRFDWTEISNANVSLLWNSLLTLVKFPDSSEHVLFEEEAASTDRVISGDLQVIEQIRHIAGRQQDFSAMDYYLGLFYHASSRFILSNDTEKRVHAFITASILAEKIHSGMQVVDIRN